MRLFNKYPVPPGGRYEHGNGGTEYFLSALDFNGTLDNRITIWAITNTSSLNTKSPALAIQNTVIDSEAYGQPPDAQQRPEATPLADLIRSGAFGGKANNGLELIAGNDDRMNQAVFAAGNLWSAVNTVVKSANGPTRVGLAYFIVKPSFSGSQLTASLIKQGYVGPSYFPSAAYATLDAVNGAGDVRLAATGAGPEDGFTGYAPFSSSSTARWGDYHTAVADADGLIWFNVEYIPNAPRTVLANWGTFVGKVHP